MSSTSWPFPLFYHSPARSLVHSRCTLPINQSLFSHYHPINTECSYHPPISLLIPTFSSACSSTFSISLLIPSSYQPALTSLQSTCSYQPFQPACSYHPPTSLLIPSSNQPAHTILQPACSYHPSTSLLIPYSNLPDHTILQSDSS